MAASSTREGKLSFFALFLSALLIVVSATHGGRHNGPGGGGGGGSTVSCPESGGFEGSSTYVGIGPSAAPLRGTVACVDHPIEVTTNGGQTSIGTLIYGPFEAGFSNDQLQRLFQCTNLDAQIEGGFDTLLAERMVEYQCSFEEGTANVLNPCGGHANPFHYHERMTCLYHSDETTGHSTRVGTALDGNGIYGKYIDGGIEPTDLDACGGRTGVTPDSNGQEVYYYVLQDVAPFTVGCFGPVGSLEECRALYSTCDDGDEVDVTTQAGTKRYDPDCPCFDKSGSNVKRAPTNAPINAPTKAPTDPPTNPPVNVSTKSPTATPPTTPPRKMV